VRTLLTAVLAIASSAVFASPDCSNAGPKPSSECAAKIDYCRHTSIVLVLAVRGRADGMTEEANFSRLNSNAAQEVWYAKNGDVVKDIVHQIYSKEADYQKLKARIATSVQAMALAIPALTQGCDGDSSVTFEAR
jgi:hypothetical protein